MGIITYLTAGTLICRRIGGMKMPKYTATPLLILAGAVDFVTYYYAQNKEQNMFQDILNKTCEFDEKIISTTITTIAKITASIRAIFETQEDDPS